MKKLNTEFFGQKVTNASYNAAHKIYDNFDARISAHANAAAFEYIVNGDRDFLDALFLNNDRVRLASGQLNAHGKKLAAYIAAFSPITVSWDKKAETLVIKKTNNKKQKHCFFNGQSGEKREAVEAATNAQWPLTMSEWEKQKDNAPKKETAPRAVSPNALKTRVQSLAESMGNIDARKVSGADLSDLMLALDAASKQAQALLDANIKAASANAETVDEQRALQSGTGKPSSAEKQANNFKERERAATA